jgi:hypothetical protein
MEINIWWLYPVAGSAFLLGFWCGGRFVIDKLKEM